MNRIELQSQRLRLFVLVAGSAMAGIAGAGPSSIGEIGWDRLGQDPPGTTMEIFAPGLVSTALNESRPPQFSPDGREAIWSVDDCAQHVIMRAKKEDGRWLEPDVAPFSGRYSDEMPVYSPDGSRLFFRSKRPLERGAAPTPDFRSWVVEKEGDQWGEPRRLPEYDLHAIVSFGPSGELYSHSAALPGEGQFDIFVSRPDGSGWGEPVNLGGPINTAGAESSPSLSPDGTIILFHAVGHPAGNGPLVSFLGPDGGWGDPKPLLPAYDSNRFDRFATFSPDGGQLLFSCWRFDRVKGPPRDKPRTWDEIKHRLGQAGNFKRDIYWIDVIILEKLRPLVDGLLAGNYLGQEAPGMIPVVFGPGFVSTGMHEHSGANFSPDGNELFFIVCGVVPHTLIQMVRREGRWSRPEVASFSGIYTDDCPSFTPDGKRLYYQSKRPQAEGEVMEGERGTWYVERGDSGWSEPVLDKELTAMGAKTPSYARNGNVYFAKEDDETGQLDLWKVEPRPGGGYTEPEKLGPHVNSENFEAWHFIHPDEKYIIFSSYGRPTGEGLYISFRDENGDWERARWMGMSVNGGGQTRMPRLSPDGKYLFFNRSGSYFADHSSSQLSYEDLVGRSIGPRNSPGDIYWVDAQMIEKIRAIEHPDIMAAMIGEIDRAGTDGAEALYHELKRMHPDYYDFSMDLLNNLGYRLLGAGRADDAVEMFGLNTRLFSDQANPYDSLAEACMAAGKNAEAIDACRKALAIEPTLPTSVTMLRSLGGL